MTTDVHGQKVVTGAKVKVLHIDPVITEFLPEEVRDILSMLHDILLVSEVSDTTVTVEKSWDRGEGRVESHSLCLKSDEIELVHSPE